VTETKKETGLSLSGSVGWDLTVQMKKIGAGSYYLF